MSSFPILLAQDAPFDPASRVWRSMNGSLGGVFIIFAVIGVLTVALVVWAVWFRKRPRHHHHLHHHHHQPSDPPATSSPRQNHGSADAGHKHRGRRRRDHRPRNPTLAETGGLPPIRPEGPSEPSS